MLCNALSYSIKYPMYTCACTHVFACRHAFEYCDDFFIFQERRLHAESTALLRVRRHTCSQIYTYTQRVMILKLLLRNENLLSRGQFASTSENLHSFLTCCSHRESGMPVQESKHAQSTSCCWSTEPRSASVGL
jgi:hypothetical protein